MTILPNMTYPMLYFSVELVGRFEKMLNGEITRDEVIAFINNNQGGVFYLPTRSVKEFFNSALDDIAVSRGWDWEKAKTFLFSQSS